jgi:hypothetical protein
MALDLTSRFRHGSNLGGRPQPISARAKAAAAISEPEEVESSQPIETPWSLTLGYVVKQYDLLYPLEPCSDFIVVRNALEQGHHFMVGEHKQGSPVIDKWMIKSGTIVILCYGRRNSLQKPYKMD